MISRLHARAARISEFDRNATSLQPNGPSLPETLLVFAGMVAVHVSLICRVNDFWDARTPFFDGGQYLRIAAIIRHGYVAGQNFPYHFWGFPYAIAFVSKLFIVPEPKALVLVSILASTVVCVLVHRLYGGWVAAVFIFVNYEWIQLSVEGGSEPLFMSLLFASFLAARNSRWAVAAFLASLCTTVRPVGVLALLSLAVILARRRNHRKLIEITFIGLAIGILYIVPIWIIVGNPFANIAGYRGEDWGRTGLPFTYPFGALVPSYLNALHGHQRWPALLFSGIWLVVALVGLLALWLPRKHPKFSSDDPEFLFLVTYILFFLVYNYDGVALHLDRFLIPILPLLLFSLNDWIPRRRLVLYAGAVLSAIVASAGVVGFRNVFGFRLP